MLDSLSPSLYLYLHLHLYLYLHLYLHLHLHLYMYIFIYTYTMPITKAWRRCRHCSSETDPQKNCEGIVHRSTSSLRDYGLYGMTGLGWRVSRFQLWGLDCLEFKVKGFGFGMLSPEKTLKPYKPKAQICWVMCLGFMVCGYWGLGSLGFTSLGFWV